MCVCVRVGGQRRVFSGIMRIFVFSRGESFCVAVRAGEKWKFSGRRKNKGSGGRKVFVSPRIAVIRVMCVREQSFVKRDIARFFE